jgi:hypothetical protein
MPKLSANLKQIASVALLPRNDGSQVPSRALAMMITNYRKQLLKKTISRSVLMQFSIFEKISENEKTTPLLFYTFLLTIFIS